MRYGVSKSASAPSTPKGKPVPPYLKGYLRRLDRDLNKMRSVAVNYRDYSSNENLQLLGENCIKRMQRGLTPLPFQTSNR